MKLIIAIVRPFTLDKIVVALEDIENFPGITITDVEGFGHRLRTSAYDSLNPFKLKKQIERHFVILGPQVFAATLKL